MNQKFMITIPAIFLLIFSLALVGCTDPSQMENGPAKETKKESAEKTKNQERPSQSKDFKPGTDAAGMIQDGPGPMAGDHFSESALESVLDGFPQTITAEEAYKTLIFQLAEDYSTHIKAINQISSDFHVTSDMKPYEINNQLNEKERHLSHHYRELRTKRSRERDRFKEALRYLKNQIGEDAHSELEYKLENRYSLIKKYTDKVYDKKKKEIENKEMQAKAKLDK